MKKTVSMVLAAMMAVALPGAALAVGQGEASTQNVTGHYVSGGESSVVYSVDISWDPLDFTYTDAFKGNWNPTTHEYEGGTEASWTPGNATITVTNHSNAAITATPSYQPESEFESASMTFDKDSFEVASADNATESGAGTPVTGTLEVTPSGSLPEGADGTIGTITITIS